MQTNSRTFRGDAFIRTLQRNKKSFRFVVKHHHVTYPITASVLNFSTIQRKNFESKARLVHSTHLLCSTSIYDNKQNQRLRPWYWHLNDQKSHFALLSWKHLKTFFRNNSYSVYFSQRYSPIHNYSSLFSSEVLTRKFRRKSKDNPAVAWKEAFPCRKKKFVWIALLKKNRFRTETVNLHTLHNAASD